MPSEKRCPNCQCRDIVIADTRGELHGGLREVCAKCGIPVRLWGRWLLRAAALTLAANGGVTKAQMMHAARRALGRK